MNYSNNEIVLIRGLPGSGKSTLAKTMQGYTHFEADMFLEVNGIYQYDPSKIKDAHDWCVHSAKKALDKGENVVIANTFVKIWEMERYTKLGYKFNVIEMKNLWPNIHGVPAEVIKHMKETWQNIPSNWISP